ncbi:glycosyltransferase family 2 protein [Arthrobacter sp. KBS0703]|uniref:glycosyltransferase family A protein n=1 Tax=Arthrobacter sp. KBS0703 TaxID=1955698 RepID=UPI00111632F4|nr:glycosyltransferase family 2 protein [Arthrobacter sp. KBS0703]TSE14718.1 glycosyltransferase family 2 protein [Arthrobacter sp. KBS0703]
MRCVIAVCTYRRPLLLNSLLEQLLDQAQRNLDLRLQLIVVDNDEALSARPVVEEFARRSSPLITEYVSAQPQGLVVARNAALEYAKSLGSPIIFIDDDETPRDEWLSSIWAMHSAFPRDIVAGPVIPKFESDLPNWCEDGSFWMRPTFADATPLTKPTGDGNILYPIDLVNRWRYSLRFNTSGGQDTHLLRRWMEAGGVVRWSARAEVDEIVPAGRLTFAYALDRTYFSSLAYVWVDRELGATRWWTLLRSGRRYLIGGLDYAAATLRQDWGRQRRAKLHFASARGTRHGLKLSSFDRYADYQIDAAEHA